jgi:hypothetical protein
MLIVAVASWVWVGVISACVAVLVAALALRA